MTDRLLPSDPLLLASLRLGEGFRSLAYPDPKSGGDPWTVGYGHTKGVRKGDTVTPDRAEADLVEDAADAFAALDLHEPWWRSMSLPRQRVLAEMCFNMGYLSADRKHGLGTFHNTLAAMQRKDFKAAAAGMLASQWARDVGQRATRLALAMELG